MKKLTVFIWFVISLGFGILPLQGATFAEVFPSPANSLGGSMSLANSAVINGTTANTIFTKSWANNGALCDGMPCSMNNDVASSYSFTLDLGSGTNTIALNSGDTQTYSTSKDFAGINLNPGSTLNLNGDITIKINGSFSPSSTININGNVIIHSDDFNQNAGNINVISGSLTIIANSIILDSASTISSLSLLCLANNQLILNENVTITGFLYSNGAMFLNKGCVVNGAVTANTLTLNEDSTINYGLSVVTHTISGKIYDSTTSSNISNANVLLYQDKNSDGQPDSGDIQVDSTTTDSSGNYSFAVADGSYFVIVDSQSLHSDSNVWMEQSHGPAGSICANGSGSTMILGSNGFCFGGKTGDGTDDITSITTAEHIALVDLNSTDINSINFAFSSNVVSNINDSDQGSLRQFIQNANAISGANIMKFVPSIPKNSSNWWTITLASALPNIIDSLTTINGTAYYFDGTIRDTNSGMVGHSGDTVGTGADALESTGDESILPNFYKPELEINGNDKGNVFFITANNSIIKNIAVYNNSDGGNGDRGITVLGNNNTVSNCFIGSRANGLDAGSGNRFGTGIAIEPTSLQSRIENNYIAYLDSQGIWMRGTGVLIHNDVSYTGLDNDLADGITVESSLNSDIIIEENIISNIRSFGVESWDAIGGFVVRNNTIISTGLGGIENGGIRLFGDNSTIINNVIKDSSGAGIVVAIEGTGSSKNNLITKNSIYNNGTISIDLDHTNTVGTINGDGISSNNDVKDTLKVNSDMDYPIFTKATLSGSILHMDGYIGSVAGQSSFANATVEVYKVDNDGDANGEGRSYLGNCTSDASGNIGCDITIPSSVMVDIGDSISATATDVSNNTSELGPNKLIESPYAFSCEQEAYIFSSLNINQPTDAYVIDISGNDYNKSATAFHPSNINAIGYNITDNYIWGYDRKNHTVVKVDNRYTTETLSLTGTLPAYDFHIGDVSPAGVLYLTQRDDSLVYRIDVNPTSITYGYVLSSISLSIPIKAADFAFSSKDNMLYYVSDDEFLMQIDPLNGTVINLGQNDLPSVSEVHSAFFDKSGFMYAFHGRYNYIYRFAIPASPVSGTSRIATTKFANINLGQSGDGARCANAPMDTKALSIEPKFNIIDGGLGYIQDGNITTKKAGELFSLSILAQDNNTTAPLNDVNITQLKLYDCDHNIIDNSWWSGPSVTTNFEGYVEINDLLVDQAHKCLEVEAYGEYDGNVNHSFGSDQFAVRPTKFEFVGLPSIINAGLEFPLRIEAVNPTGTAIVGYNESINSSFEIIAHELDINCSNGVLNVSGAHFIDGVLDHNATYDNVGDINIYVREINGSEFAFVDKDDTSDSQRLIESRDITKTFVPNGFSLEWNLTNQNSSPDFTYFSDDPTQAAAVLNIRAAANNFLPAITNNYKNECASNNVDITVSFDINGSDGSTYTLKWKDNDGVEDSKVVTPNQTDTFIYTIDKSKFIDGEITQTIRLNFARSRNKALEPLDFFISDIKVEDTVNNVESNLSGNELATYYYGRLHAPDYYVVGDEMNSTIFYELFCNNCDKSKFILTGKNESADSVHWYILDNNIRAFNNNPESVNGVVVDGINNSTINLSSPNLPFTDKIKYIPLSWLLYNKYNAAATMHFFNVHFSSEGRGWAGKGDVGIVIDRNISHKGSKKMEW